MEKLIGYTNDDMLRILAPDKGKLVRDEIPGRASDEYEVVSLHELGTQELRLKAASHKIMEEGAETSVEMTRWIEDPTEENRRRILEEVADSRDAGEALIQELGFTMDDLLKAQVEKKAKNGGYTKWFFMKYRRRQING